MGEVTVQPNELKQKTLTCNTGVYIFKNTEGDFIIFKILPYILGCKTYR